MKLKHWLTLVILLLPAITSLLHFGYFGASDDMHIGWLYEMHRAVTAGKFPPRFVPDLSYGFGYPLFNFVYPLPFYLGEIFHQLFSLVDSIKFVFFVSLIFSGVSMYTLARNFSSRTSSLLAALVYVYTPYRSTDIYVRGAIGEAFAFIFFPLILLSLSKTSRRWTAIGGLSIAGLILSHNISAYMFIPFALLYALINRIPLKRCLLAFGLGILVSLYFWLPALKDSSLLHYDTVFNFADHFPTLKQLITPYWGYGASVPGPYDGLSFFLGFANLLALFIAPFFFIRSPHKKIYTWSYLTVIISIFMMNFRSSFLWQHLPLLPYFQFPWRFLTLTTFATSFLISQISIPAKYMSLFIIPLLLVSSSIFRPHDFLDRSDSYYLNRYIPYPSASPDYRLTQEEYLRLPNNTNTRPQDVAPLLSYSPSVSNFVQLNAYDASFVSTSPVNYVIDYNKYLFPGWTAKIDNHSVPITAADPYGQISISLPAGTHSVFVSYQETGFNLFLDLISLLGITTALALIVYEKK